jgi:exocyst complex component 2
VEDDDDDEELLSISSEDESSTTQRRPNPATAPKTRPPVRHQEQQWDDDEGNYDDDDDDDEPSTWKPGYKSELERRVRELRETRGASTAVQLQRARTIVDSAVSRGDDFVDPLGLGAIDPRSLTLVPKSTRSGERSPADRGDPRGGKRGAFLRSRKDGPSPAPSQDDDLPSPTGDHQAPVIRDPATREKLLYSSEKFDAKFFLSHVHQNTAAAAFEGAEEGLKEDLKLRNNELKKLVKENFDCFISCKNTIDDIHTKLEQIESNTEGGGTLHLSKSIKQVEDVANRAFSPLLERQAQVERIRSVQGMLQRFRTLFNLPSSIRTHISKGEYDQAIREYKKAKSLELYSHVNILKRVLEEVDKIVQEFKETLYKSMEDPHIEVAQLETTRRLLLELEPECDPVWHYLTVQDRKIRGLIEGCSLEHEARMEAFNGRVRDRVLSDARWKKLQVQSNKASDVDFSLLLGDHEKEGKEGSLSDTSSNESDALLGRFIRRLTMVIVHHVPQFWGLALSIFTGKFAAGASAVGRSLSRSSAGSLPREGNEKATSTSHTLEEVETMVHCIISLYESKVQAAFLQLAEANVLRPYMRDAVAEVSKACVALMSTDAAPSSAAQMLLALRTEVTRIFVLRICSLMHMATSELVSDEDWEPVATVQRISSPFAISSLPLRFQDLMVSALDHLTEMLERLSKDESQLHEDMVLQVHQMQDTVRYTFFECFLALSGNLEKLANELALATNDEETEWQDKFVGLVAGIEVASTHQRLLMVLSNVGFCHSTLLAELYRKYEHVWTYEGSDATSKGGNMATYEEVSNTLSELESKVLNHYNVAKAIEIQKAAEAYLLRDGSQWACTPPVKGFRYALMELMHPLVTTHAEVFAGAKPFLEKAINSLVEALMDSLVAIFADNKDTAFHRFDINGYCQLMLEVEYLQTVLQDYMTTQAYDLAANYRSFLLEVVMETVAEVTDQHNHGRGSLRGGSTDGYDYGGMTPEDLQGLAQDHIQSYLPVELKRTRLNVLCFMEAIPDPALPGGGGRRVIQQAKQQQQQRSAYNGAVSGRRSHGSSSSLTDSESGKLGLPPIPHDSHSPRVQDRYMRVRQDPRRPATTSRKNSQVVLVENDDLR